VLLRQRCTGLLCDTGQKLTSLLGKMCHEYHVGGARAASGRRPAQLIAVVATTVVGF